MIEVQQQQSLVSSATDGGSASISSRDGPSARLESNGSNGDDNTISSTPTMTMEIVADNAKGHSGHTTIPTNTTTTKYNNRKSRQRRHPADWLRFFFLELPLSLSFALLLLLYGLHHIYEVYYIPLTKRSTRTDDQLLEEITYYERLCGPADITSTTASDILADTAEPPSLGVAQMMKHGALLIPEVLPPDVLEDLRAYAVHRNDAVLPHEEYPVSQGRARKSFGYDATEAPAVAAAVEAITKHPYLHQLMTELLGDADPASTEITTITQYYGAGTMYWHQDTKSDGNAIKFARTYSHSYSLFMPLQNTTQQMGATEFCLGSHYCTNEDFYESCRANSIGLHQTSADGHFVAGGAALFNQHAWHMAPPHTDPDAPERVVFIMSFIARPTTNGADTRQLSRGTYFHQKWNMWGHTWFDLQNPMQHVTWPFSWLKCLALYCAHPLQHWGYDLVTATYMRFSNAQLGDDLTRLVNIWEEILHLPAEWHGPNLEYQASQKKAWKTFVHGTLEILQTKALQLTVALHLLYLQFVMIVTVWRRRRRTTAQSTTPTPQGGSLWRSTLRLLTIHSTLVTVLGWSLYKIQMSAWGQGVLSGAILKRPFAPIQILTREEEETNLLVSRGKTTLPVSADVLWGTRLDAPWLGAYEDWLHYHPGNLRFQEELLEPHARHYMLAKSDNEIVGPSALQRRILESIQDTMRDTTGGRFLLQDFRTGDWRRVTPQEQVQLLDQQLIVASSRYNSATGSTNTKSVVQSLDKQIRRMVAHYRFNSLNRGSVLARKSVVYLYMLQQRILTQAAGRIPNASRRLKSASPLETNPLLPLALNLQAATLAQDHSFGIQDRFTIPSVAAAARQALVPGTAVWVQELDNNDEWKWFRGEIMKGSDYGGYDDTDYDEDDEDHLLTIGFEIGTVEEHPVSNIVRYEPTTEGDDVMVCYQSGLRDCYEGIILRVRPTASIDVIYEEEDDSGYPDYAWGMSPMSYYREPYVYQAPYFSEEEEDDE